MEAALYVFLFICSRVLCCSCLRSHFATLATLISRFSCLRVSSANITGIYHIPSRIIFEDFFYSLMVLLSTTMFAILGKY